MSQIDGLLTLLKNGQDSALLRFGLGNALVKEGRTEEALEHFASATRQDPGYSAAWKLYGKALTEVGRAEEAMEVYRQGIEAAQGKGDLQAVKEMQVFLKRLQKQAQDGN